MGKRKSEHIWNILLWYLLMAFILSLVKLTQYYAQDTGIPYYQSKGTVEQLDAINQQIKKTELNRIINDIQKQLDEYLKRE